MRSGRSGCIIIYFGLNVESGLHIRRESYVYLRKHHSSLGITNAIEQRYGYINNIRRSR